MLAILQIADQWIQFRPKALSPMLTTGTEQITF